MDADDEEIFIIIERGLAEGHNIYYANPVLNLASLKTNLFRHDFRTTCEVSPTSWQFDLVYREITERNELSFSVTFRRDDAMKINMDANILVEICDYHDCPIYPPNDFQKYDMNPGDAIQETVFRIRPLQLMGRLQDNQVIVNVTMMVRSCHSHSDE